jgi:hypothetical protein
MIERPVESGCGGDAVVCADSVGSDRGGSGERAQHDSVHRPVDLGLGRSWVRLIVEHQGGVICYWEPLRPLVFCQRRVLAIMAYQYSFHVLNACGLFIRETDLMPEARG